jgi:uncharacterized damage-inducible protein DinB
MPVNTAFLSEYAHEVTLTRKVLARIPEDQFAYKPHESATALGQLASHLVELYGWGIGVMKADSIDLAPVDGPKHEPYSAQSSAELLAKFEENAAAFQATLAEATDDAQWFAPWSLLMAGEVRMSMPRIACIRGMIFNHAIHHRAQIAVYLRMLNIPVPAIYGPSGDEMS